MNNNYEKITDSNNVIYENLTKIYEKIFLLKNTYNLEEDDEYEELIDGSARNNMIHYLI